MTFKKDVLVVLTVSDNELGWSAKQMAAHLGCSYSSARVPLIKLFYDGKATRIQRRGEWCYKLIRK